MATALLRMQRTGPREGVARAADIEAILEAQLEREALGTERLRLLVLLTVIGGGLALSLISPAYFSDQMERAFRHNLQSFVNWRFAVIAVLVLYLAMERVVLGHVLKSGGRVPAFYRYVTAFVETSCPTAEIVVAASFTDPVAALSTMPGFVYPLFIVLSALRLNFRLSVFTGAVAALEYMALGIVYLGADGGAAHNPFLASGFVHLLKCLILLLLGVITGLVALQLKRRLLDSLRSAEERNAVVDTFGRHVSPAVVQQLLAQGAEMRGEKREVCVMFLDIRNFTAFAEPRSPEEVVAYLESLFGFMIEIVNRHHGHVNKFLGDGFMAVFGAPVSDGRDCASAVAASREILRRLEEEVARGAVLPTAVGIGLHSGEVVTGSIGSSARREYTVIGDVVNLASRIEQLNKRFGSRLLVSESVWDAVGGVELTGADPLGSVSVKGRQTPIRVYRLA